MLKRSLGIVLATLLALVGSAQNTDSLWGAWQNTSLPDSSRSKAILTLRKVVNSSKSLEVDSVLAFFEYAVEATRGFSNPRTIGLLQQELYRQYFIRDQLDQAMVHLQVADSIWQILNDSNEIADVLQDYGAIYSNSGELSLALEKNIECLDFRLAMGDSDELAAAYLNIGSVLLVNYELERAKPYFNKAIVYGRKYQNHRHLSMALQNQALIFGEEGDSFNQIKNLKEAEILTKKSNNLRGQGMVLGNLAEAYLKLDSIDLANEYALEALSVRKKLGAKIHIGISYMVLGMINQKQKSYLEAVKFAEQANELVGKTKHWDVIAANSEVLYKCYEALGRFEKSLNYYKTHRNALDTIENRSVKEDLLTQQLEWEYKQQHQQDSLATEAERAMERAKLETEELKRIAAQRQNWILLGVLVFVAIVLLLLYNRFRLTQRQNQVIEEQRLSLEQQNENLTRLSEFKESMTSMLIHDLKNPLNIILAAKTATIEGAKQVERSAKVMMQLVSNLLDINKYEDSHLVLSLAERDISEPIHAATSQVMVFAQERKLNLQTDFQVKTKIYADSGLIERVMVNLLTNAIRHSHTNNIVTIRVQKGVQQERSIRIEVEDSGIGIARENLDRIFERNFTLNQGRSSGHFRSSGLGLAFCKIAVEAHGGSIGVHSVEGEGAKFWLELPADHKAFQSVSEQKWLMTADLIQILSAATVQEILPTANELKQIPFYNVSRMSKALDSMSEGSTEANQWKAAVLQTIYNSNEEEFNRLLSLVE